MFNLPASYVRATRLLPGYRWWKPLLAVLLAALFAIGFSMMVFLAFVLVELAVDPAAFLESLAHGEVAGFRSDGTYLGVDLTNAASIAVMLLTVAVMLPAAGLASLAAGLGGLRTMSSVEGKLRLSVLKGLAPVTIIATAVCLGLQMALSIALDPADSLGAMTVAPVALLAIVVLTPFQAAAEEYVFRGLLMQALGSWIPVVIIPILLQAVVFASFHTYNIWGILDVAVTGLCYGYIAAKTGGLEAGILLHSANNILAFAVGSLFASQVTQSDVTVIAFAMDSLIAFALTAITLWVAKRKGFLIADSPALKAALSKPAKEQVAPVPPEQ